MNSVCWILGLVLAIASVEADSLLGRDHEIVSSTIDHSAAQLSRNIENHFLDETTKYTDVMSHLMSWKREENTKHILACENKPNIWASCPAGKVMYVQEGFFGRDDSTTCPSVKQPIMTKTCSSSVSLWKLKQLCNKKNTCLLQPFVSVFGEPCLGIDKYIKMTFICLPRVSAKFLSFVKTSSPKFLPRIDSFLFEKLNELETFGFSNKMMQPPIKRAYSPLIMDDAMKQVVACPNIQETVVRCPAGKVISVQDGFFGRDDSTTCADAGKIISVTKCSSPMSLWKLKQLCSNKNTCLLKPFTSVYGEPCVGVQKYIKMSYKCLPTEFVTQNQFPILPSEMLKEYGQGSIAMNTEWETEIMAKRLLKEMLEKCLMTMQWSGRSNHIENPRFNVVTRDDVVQELLEHLLRRQLVVHHTTGTEQKPLTKVYLLKIFIHDIMENPNVIKERITHYLINVFSLNSQMTNWRMENHRPSWSTLENHRPSSTLENHRPSWTTLENHRPSWSTLENHRPSWSTLENHRPSSTLENHLPSWSTVENHRPSWSTLENHQPSLTNVESYLPLWKKGESDQQRMVRLDQVRSTVSDKARTTMMQSKAKVFAQTGHALPNHRLETSPMLPRDIDVVRASRVENDFLKHPMLWNMHNQFGDKTQDIVVCEKDQYILKCPPHKIIRVIDGYFGRADTTTCLSKPSSLFPVCKDQSSLEILKRTCFGRNSCLLQPRSVNVLNSCTGARGYIKMSYQCISIE